MYAQYQCWCGSADRSAHSADVTQAFWKVIWQSDSKAFDPAIYLPGMSLTDAS